METIIIFGAGNTGKRVFNELSSSYTVCCFMDNDEDKWNTTVNGIKVLEPNISNINKYEFHFILICSVYGKEKIKEQLLNLGVKEEKIKMKPSNPDVLSPFLKNLSELVRLNNVTGQIAEVGVFQGESAEKMNRFFPTHFLYLFDTFEGFADADCAVERTMNYSEAKEGQFDDTSVERVMKRMPYPKKVIIRKGYFPDTAVELHETFSLVRIDMDLYQPTVAALAYFDQCMTRGGVIIVHDYFGEAYKGVKKAVNDYVSEKPNLRLLPIGDMLSIAIVGY